MKKYLVLIFIIVVVAEILLRIVNLKENRIIEQTDFFIHLNAVSGEEYIKKSIELGIKPKGKPNKKYRLRNQIPPYNYFTATYNNFGFRGENIKREKAKDVYRIFVMGDSTIVGWGVEDNETLSANLQRVLSKNIKNKKFEVINGGSPGATLSDGIKLLEEIVKFKPDIVIANYLENDIAFHGAFSLKKKIGNTPLKIIPYLDKSEIFLTLRSLLNYFFIKKGISGSKFLLKINTPYSPENYRKKLRKFYNMCKENNIKLIYINIPLCLKLDHLFYKSLRDLREHYKNIIREEAKRNNFGYLELEKYFREYPISFKEISEFEKRSNWIEYFPFKRTKFLIKEYYPLYVDLSHPNNAGFKLVAEVLLKEVLNLINGK
jgi:lysophospholipase L1-like esterase